MLAARSRTIWRGRSLKQVLFLSLKARSQICLEVSKCRLRASKQHSKSRRASCLRNKIVARRLGKKWVTLRFQSNWAMSRLICQRLWSVSMPTNLITSWMNRWTQSFRSAKMMTPNQISPSSPSWRSNTRKKKKVSLVKIKRWTTRRWLTRKNWLCQLLNLKCCSAILRQSTWPRSVCSNAILLSARKWFRKWYRACDNRQKRNRETRSACFKSRSCRKLTNSSKWITHVFYKITRSSLTNTQAWRHLW